MAPSNTVALAAGVAVDVVGDQAATRLSIPAPWDAAQVASIAEVSYKRLGVAGYYIPLNPY